MEHILANDDLRRHIFSFGEPDHRERMKQLSYDLVVHVDAIDDGIRTDRGERTAIEYFRDEYTAEELVTCSRYLNRCKCCTRHSQCKPYLEWVDGVQHVRIPEQIRTPRNLLHNLNHCDCPCRNLSRNMMKTYLLYHLEID